jgi:hypothetical protein
MFNYIICMWNYGYVFSNTNANTYVFSNTNANTSLHSSLFRLQEVGSHVMYVC